jgi:aryl-alcohol dehydrogenase-like predicted oxidoreductase
MDNATPIEETLEALHDVVKAGTARYLGASSMHAWEFAKVLHVLRMARPRSAPTKDGWPIVAVSDPPPGRSIRRCPMR